MDMMAQTSTANVNLEESLRKLMSHLHGWDICQAWAELLEAEDGSKEEMLERPFIIYTHGQ